MFYFTEGAFLNVCVCVIIDLSDDVMFMKGVSRVNAFNQVWGNVDGE